MDAEFATADENENVTGSHKMHRVLIARNRLRPGRFNDGPSVLTAADREPVEVCVYDFDVWLEAFDAAEYENAFQLDLLRHQIPLDLRQVG